MVSVLVRSSNEHSGMVCLVCLTPLFVLAFKIVMDW
jgi:hypothetical protein